MNGVLLLFGMLALCHAHRHDIIEDETLQSHEHIVRIGQHLDHDTMENEVVLNQAKNKWKSDIEFEKFERSIEEQTLNEQVKSAMREIKQRMSQVHDANKLYDAYLNDGESTTLRYHRRAFVKKLFSKIPYEDENQDDDGMH